VVVWNVRGDRVCDCSYFDVEPYTGAVLNGYMRVQVNMEVGKIVFTDGKKTTIYENASRTMLPLYWFEEVLRVVCRVIG
jgi:hypothetical protein